MVKEHRTKRLEFNTYSDFEIAPQVDFQPRWTGPLLYWWFPKHVLWYFRLVSGIIF